MAHHFPFPGIGDLLSLLRGSRKEAILYKRLYIGQFDVYVDVISDTAPELQYTFIEQALRPGPAVSLRCSATGSPAPSFSWHLDGQELLASHRHAMGQTLDAERGEVVALLNLTTSRAEDGGLYSCTATNSVGQATHTARLNIYGNRTAPFFICFPLFYIMCNHAQ